MTGTVAAPASTTMPRAIDWTMAAAWRTVSILRLSDRSAMAPAHAPSRSIGPNWNAMSRPRATPESVSFRTSSVWVTIVSQLPVWLTSWPPKNRRKLRWWRERKVSEAAVWSFSVMQGLLLGGPPSRRSGWGR